MGSSKLAPTRLGRVKSRGQARAGLYAAGEWRAMEPVMRKKSSAPTRMAKMSDAAGGPGDGCGGSGSDGGGALAVRRRVGDEVEGSTERMRARSDLSKILTPSGEVQLEGGGAGCRGLAPQDGAPPRGEHGVSAPKFRGSNFAPLPEVATTRRKRSRWSRRAGLASLAATFAAAGSSVKTGSEGPGCRRRCGAAECSGRRTRGP